MRIKKPGYGLTGTTLEFLAEEDQLDLIVEGKDTSTSDTTEDVGACTLEQRSYTFLGNDLLEGLEG